MDTFFLFPKGVCLGADYLTFEWVWVISGKKVSCRLISREKKILAWKYLVKKISFKVYKAEKINLTPLYARKKILSPEVWGKKFFPKPNHPYPPSKVKWLVP